MILFSFLGPRSFCKPPKIGPENKKKAFHLFPTHGNANFVRQRQKQLRERKRETPKSEEANTCFSLFLPSPLRREWEANVCVLERGKIGCLPGKISSTSSASLPTTATPKFRFPPPFLSLPFKNLTSKENTGKRDSNSNQRPTSTSSPQNRSRPTMQISNGFFFFLCGGKWPLRIF